MYPEGIHHDFFNLADFDIRSHDIYLGFLGDSLHPEMKRIRFLLRFYLIQERITHCSFSWQIQIDYILGCNRHRPVIIIPGHIVHPPEFDLAHKTVLK